MCSCSIGTPPVRLRGTLFLLLLLLPLPECGLPSGCIRKTDIKLRHQMTRWQRHPAQILNVPRRQQNPAIIRLCLQFRNHLFDLVDTLSRIIRVTIFIFRPKMTPLKPIDGSQVTFFTEGLRRAQTVEVRAGTVTVPDVDVLGG